MRLHLRPPALHRASLLWNNYHKSHQCLRTNIHDGANQSLGSPLLLWSFGRAGRIPRIPRSPESPGYYSAATLQLGRAFHHLASSVARAEQLPSQGSYFLSSSWTKKYILGTTNKILVRSPAQGLLLTAEDRLGDYSLGQGISRSR